MSDWIPRNESVGSADLEVNRTLTRQFVWSQYLETHIRQGGAGLWIEKTFCLKAPRPTCTMLTFVTQRQEVSHVGDIRSETPTQRLNIRLRHALWTAFKRKYRVVDLYYFVYRRWKSNLISKPFITLHCSC